MSGGGGTNTVSQTTIPPEILPYFQTALQGGQSLLDSGGPQYYPGQQVAPLNPLQEQGLNSVAQTAGAPSATSSALPTNEYLSSGALMNPATNPYLNATYQQGANQVQNTLASQFGSAGRNIIGSAPVQSDSLNNLATQIYGGAYNQGLQTTTQNEALAPSLDASSYMPSQQLLSAGSGLQGQTQNLINANMNAYNYNQQLPYNQLSWYSGLLGENASPFKSQSGSTTGTSNPWATAAGGASLAASLYGSGAFTSAGLLGSATAAGTAASDIGAIGEGAVMLA